MKTLTTTDAENILSSIVEYVKNPKSQSAKSAINKSIDTLTEAISDQKIEDEKIEWTRVNSDSNGNPRYVTHFLNFQKPGEKINYETALKRAKKIGGGKFNNKQYGGGIVFQSYNISDVEKEIKELLENIGKYKVAFVQILHDGSTKKGLTEITYNTKEAAEVYAKQLKRNNTGIKSAKVVEA